MPTGAAQNGKGDKPRPTDGKKYRKNYERIFGKKPPPKEKPVK